VRQIFIFGVARSGTNLIARLLNTHKKIHFFLDPFLPIFKSLLQNFSVNNDELTEIKNCKFLPDYYFLKNNQKIFNLIFNKLSLNSEIPEYLLSNLNDNFLERYYLENDEKVDLKKMKNIRFYNEYFDFLFEETKIKRNLDIVGSKEVWTIEFIPSILRHYQKAKFVIINRDPRAIIMSMIKLGLKDQSQKANIIGYIRHWRKNFEIYQILDKLSATKNKVFFLDYENFLLDEEKYLNDLEFFLDIELKKSIDLNISGWSGNSSYKNIKGISKTNANKWKEDISDDLENLIIFMCFKEMLLLGYDVGKKVKKLNTKEIEKTFNKFFKQKGSWKIMGENAKFNFKKELERFEMSMNTDRQKDVSLFLSSLK
tara:strand:+ start:21764 stop:22873 length:1110 start_codon:yes stop_codon:yes gene_type:complete